MNFIVSINFPIQNIPLKRLHFYLSFVPLKRKKYLCCQINHFPFFSLKLIMLAIFINIKLCVVTPCFQLLIENLLSKTHCSAVCFYLDCKKYTPLARHTRKLLTTDACMNCTTQHALSSTFFSYMLKKMIFVTK